MKRRHFILTSIAATFIMASGVSQDIVQWRGTDRTGVYNENNLLKVWPAEGPQMLWSFDGLGKGFTSVTIADGKIFTTGESDGKGYIFALDMNGKQLWKTEYGKEWSESYPGSRTTPVYFKGKLYLATGHGEAICVDGKTGSKLWSVNMMQKFGARNLRWGIVEAPVISDNKVFFSPGGEEVSIVALDLNSGETIWTTKGLGETSAYCSPLLVEHNSQKLLVTSMEKHVVGIDVNTGALLWKIPQVNVYSIHPNTPLYKNGNIYSVTGYKTGGVMFKLSNDGKTATELWRNTTLDNQIGGAVWIDNYIIGSGHQNDRNWQCLNATTGEVLHKTNAIGKGVVVYADGLLYCYADNGEMGILEITDNGFELKSKFRIHLGTDQHWAHPVIDKGIMYIRRGNTLMAYSVKK